MGKQTHQRYHAYLLSNSQPIGHVNRQVSERPSRHILMATVGKSPERMHLFVRESKGFVSVSDRLHGLWLVCFKLNIKDKIWRNKKGIRSVNSCGMIQPFSFDSLFFAIPNWDQKTVDKNGMNNHWEGSNNWLPQGFYENEQECTKIPFRNEQ